MTTMASGSTLCDISCIQASVLSIILSHVSIFHWLPYFIIPEEPGSASLFLLILVPYIKWSSVIWDPSQMFI